MLDPELDYFVVFERNAQLPATTLAALLDVFQGRRSIRKPSFSNFHEFTKQMSVRIFEDSGLRIMGVKLGLSQ